MIAYSGDIERAELWTGYAEDLLARVNARAAKIGRRISMNMSPEDGIEIFTMSEPGSRCDIYAGDDRPKMVRIPFCVAIGKSIDESVPYLVDFIGMNMVFVEPGQIVNSEDDGTSHVAKRFTREELYNLMQDGYETDILNNFRASVIGMGTRVEQSMRAQGVYSDGDSIVLIGQVDDRIILDDIVTAPVGPVPEIKHKLFDGAIINARNHVLGKQSQKIRA